MWLFRYERMGIIMDMPFIPSQDTYTKAKNRIENAFAKTVGTIQVQPRAIIHNAHNAVGVREDESGILDIAVSFDGS